MQEKATPHAIPKPKTPPEVIELFRAMDPLWSILSSNEYIPTITRIYFLCLKEALAGRPIFTQNIIDASPVGDRQVRRHLEQLQDAGLVLQHNPSEIHLTPLENLCDPNSSAALLRRAEETAKLFRQTALQALQITESAAHGHQSSVTGNVLNSLPIVTNRHGFEGGMTHHVQGTTQSDGRYTTSHVRNGHIVSRPVGGMTESVENGSQSDTSSQKNDLTQCVQSRPESDMLSHGVTGVVKNGPGSDINRQKGDLTQCVPGVRGSDTSSHGVTHHVQNLTHHVERGGGHIVSENTLDLTQDVIRQIAEGAAPDTMCPEEGANLTHHVTPGYDDGNAHVHTYGLGQGQGQEKPRPRPCAHAYTREAPGHEGSGTARVQVEPADHDTPQRCETPAEILAKKDAETTPQQSLDVLWEGLEIEGGAPDIPQEANHQQVRTALAYLLGHQGTIRSQPRLFMFKLKDVLEGEKPTLKICPEHLEEMARVPREKRPEVFRSIRGRIEDEVWPEAYLQNNEGEWSFADFSSYPMITDDPEDMEALFQALEKREGEQ